VFHPVESAQRFRHSVVSLLGNGASDSSSFVFVEQGRTLEEVIAAKPTASYDAEWGQSFQSAKTFLTWVYQGV
jgi:hypothetical protein